VRDVASARHRSGSHTLRAVRELDLDRAAGRARASGVILAPWSSRSGRCAAASPRRNRLPSRSRIRRSQLILLAPASRLGPYEQTRAAKTDTGLHTDATNRTAMRRDVKSRRTSTEAGLTRSKRSKATTPTQREKPASDRGLRLERNTGFEPATFALATRQPGIHDSSLPSTNQHEPAISLGSSDSLPEPVYTNLHADSLVSGAQRVPRSRRRSILPSLDVVQVAALLGCSTAHVYMLCEQGQLPHSRDIRNAIRFDCRTLGKLLKLRLARPSGGKPRKRSDAHTSSSTAE